MYETWLIPYLEGTLDAERRAQLEARLPDDPALASELNALRRAEPRLHTIAGRLRQSEAARPASASLWPALQGRLDTRPARPPFGPAVWWTGGGLCAAGLLLLAVLFGPVLHPEVPDRRTAREYKKAPLIVSHLDNAVGTQTAERLQAHAQRVAAEKQAADTLPQTLMAARPMPTRTLPLSATVPAPPAAPPLPPAHPLQMAEREPDAQLPYPMAVPPAPTHSPPASAPAHAPLPPAAAQTEAPEAEAEPFAPAERSAGGEAAPPPVADALSAPLAAVSPAPQERRTFAKTATPRLTLRQQLEQTLTSPDYGTDAAEVREQDLLRTARPGAALGVRTEMKAEDADTQGPAAGRLLAVLDTAAGEWEEAAAQWRQLVRKPDTVAEDWFRLAQAEARLGHDEAAQQAYAQALRPSSSPLSAAHRATAVQNALLVPNHLP